jgi:Na+/phosphate symporter
VVAAAVSANALPGMRGGQTMNGLRSNQIGGIAGIVFAVGMVGFGLALLGDAPTLSESTEDVREYFDDNGDRVLVGYWFMMLFFFGGLLTFASSLRSALTTGVDGEPWGTVLLSSAVVTASVAGAGLIGWGALALNGTSAYSDSTVQMLMDIDGLIFTSILPWSLAVFLVAASVLIARDGTLWPWLGWAGFLIALSHIVGAFWVLDGDPESALGILVWGIGIIGTLLWVVVASVGMYRLDGRTSQA